LIVEKISEKYRLRQEADVRDFVSNSMKYINKGVLVSKLASRIRDAIKASEIMAAILFVLTKCNTNAFRTTTRPTNLLVRNGAFCCFLTSFRISFGDFVRIRSKGAAGNS
jgi:hypothetical protein